MNPAPHATTPRANFCVRAEISKPKVWLIKQPCCVDIYAMLSPRINLLLLTAVVVSAAATLRAEPGDKDQKSLSGAEVDGKKASKKTLLRWNSADPVGEEEDLDDRLVTDRPHFSEASSLVGLGVVQLETGYSVFMDRLSAPNTQTHSFPEPLLRMGVLAEWFEFRLGYNYLIQPTIDPLLGNNTLSGSDDLYVAAKLALTEQAGIFPEAAIFPQMRVPTGSQEFTSRQVLPGFNLAYSWKINKLWELECNTQLNRRLDDADHYYAEFIQTANLEWDLTRWIGAFTEWFCLIPSGSLVALPQHYFHGGFVVYLNKNIQLDIHSAVGLNASSDVLAYTGAGFSIRF